MKIPVEKLLELREKLHAGTSPENLLRAVEAYGLDLDDLKTIAADVQRNGPAGITFGGRVEITH